MNLKCAITTLGNLFCAGVTLMGVVGVASAGTNSSGGETGIVLDDRIIVADPFAKRIGGKNLKFGPELKEEILRIGVIMSTMGARNSSAKYQDIFARHEQPPEFLTETRVAEFITQSVLNSRVDYRVVKELPEKCRGELIEIDSSLLPQAATTRPIQTVVIGCTEKNLTRFKEEYIKLMAVRDLAIAIIHERAHSLPGGPPHEHIFLLTSGLQTALAVLNRQIHQNDRRPLSAKEIDSLKDIISGIWYLELGLDGLKTYEDYLTAYEFTPYGGIKSKEAEVSADSFVGVGSIVYAWTKLESVDSVLSSFSELSVKAASGAKVIESILVADTKPPGEKPLGPRGVVALGKDVRIFRTNLAIHPIYPNQGIRQIQFGESSQIQNSILTLVNSDLHTGDEVKLTNINSRWSTFTEVPAGFYVGNRIEIRNLQFGIVTHGFDISKYDWLGYRKSRQVFGAANVHLLSSDRDSNLYDFTNKTRRACFLRRRNQKLDSKDMYFSSGQELLKSCKEDQTY